MSTPARKIDIREANESLILRASEKMFAIHGYRGTTTESIAAEAGLPKANVHYYFKTKSNLYRQVLKSVLEEWMHAADKFETRDDPEHALRTYITAKMKFSRERPYGSLVWANEIRRGAPIIEQFLATTLKQWLNQRVAVIRTWIDRGQIRPVDPKTLLYMIWATTQHYADFSRQIEILNDGHPITDRQYDDTVEEVVCLILASVSVRE